MVHPHYQIDNNQNSNAMLGLKLHHVVVLQPQQRLAFLSKTLQ